MTRSEELAVNLAQVRGRIGAACRSAGRDPAEVTLVAVTKTHPAGDVEALAALGLVHMAENRDHEAAAKAAEVAADVVWHFVGQVQTNKARSVAGYADLVESVDRVRLVQALSHAAQDLDRTLDVLLQVALSDGEGRGGVPLDHGHRSLLELAAAAAGAPGLRLAGVMAVAPLGADPSAAFAQLAVAAGAVREEHPAATIISAGMSGDLEQAIVSGSTHVRVGTALLGARFAPSYKVALKHTCTLTRATVQVRACSCTLVHARLRRSDDMAGALRKVGLYLGLVDDEAYDDYLEEDYLEPEPEEPARSTTVRRFDERASRYEEPAAAPRPVRSAGADRVQMAPPPAPVAPEPDLYRITTLHPRNYNEARTIGECFREGTPVIMNLTEMSDGDAKRLVDFSAGLIFGLRGSIERVTNKVFLLSPANVHVTAEDKARIVEGGFFNQS